MTIKESAMNVKIETVDEFIELHQWQISHIQEGLAQAEKKKFAAEEDVIKALKRWKR